MNQLNSFNSRVKFLLTDIDDTLTDEGLLHPEAYAALWSLKNKGVHIIPITGRPAGWCEMIARMWPVAGVVGENGGFYFRYNNKKMHRHFYFDIDTQKSNRKKLDQIEKEVLNTIPGCDLASDQFCRMMDLAIDFCEDVPALPASDVEKIVAIFKSHGAQAKVSSIHVNGWFGDYNKLSMTLKFLNQEFGLSVDQAKSQCAFSGDSPNDEPMFEFFPNSFAVANINQFKNDLNFLPTYVAPSNGGKGFCQIAQQIERFL